MISFSRNIYGSWGGEDINSKIMYIHFFLVIKIYFLYDTRNAIFWNINMYVKGMLDRHAKWSQFVYRNTFLIYLWKSCQVWKITFLKNCTILKNKNIFYMFIFFEGDREECKKVEGKIKTVQTFSWCLIILMLKMKMH